MVKTRLYGQARKCAAVFCGWPPRSKVYAMVKPRLAGPRWNLPKEFSPHVRVYKCMHACKYGYIYARMHSCMQA